MRDDAKANLLVVICMVLIILVFVLIPEYEEGQKISNTTDRFLCNAECPEDCRCIARNSGCFINQNC